MSHALSTKNAGNFYSLPNRKGTEVLGGTTLINHVRCDSLCLPLTPALRCTFIQKLPGRFYTFSAEISQQMISSLCRIQYILTLFNTCITYIVAILPELSGNVKTAWIHVIRESEAISVSILLPASASLLPPLFVFHGLPAEYALLHLM